ncbi:MAG: hypothetical protein ACR2J8_10070 [Thermomicrobiales bacterium]
MNKVFCGFAAAALLTVGVAGVVGAESVIVDDNDGYKDAWVVNPPAGGQYWIVKDNGNPSTFLVDQGGNLSVQFGHGPDLDGAVVWTVMGDSVHAQGR